MKTGCGNWCAAVAAVVPSCSRAVVQSCSRPVLLSSRHLVLYCYPDGVSFLAQGSARIRSGLAAWGLRLAVADGGFGVSWPQATSLKPQARLGCGLAALCLLCVAFLGCSGREPPRIEDYVPRATVAMREPGRPPVQANTTDGPLDLDACVRVALDNNPMRRAAAEGVKAAEQAVGEARAPYFPKITGTGAYSSIAFRDLDIFGAPAGAPASFPRDLGPQNSFILLGLGTWTIYDFGNRYAQLKAAMARKAVAQEELEQTRQDIALNVHHAYYALHAAIDMQAVAENTLEQAEDDLRIARERKEVGDVAAIDVLRAELQAAEARLDLVRARSRVRISRGDLNTAMGLPVELPVDVIAPEGELMPPDAIDLDESLARAAYARPELRAALSRVDAARRSVDSARSAFYPKLTAVGLYAQTGQDFFPRGRAWVLGGFAQVPLFDGLTNVKRLGRTKAELAQAEADVQGMVLQVRSEVWTAYARLKDAFEAVAAASALVQQAERTFHDARGRYQTRAGTISEMLDTHAALARGEGSLVQARGEYRSAHAAILRAIGEITGEK